MLKDVQTIFEDYRQMMNHLKKKSYEKNMGIFIEKYGHYLTEMTDYVDKAEEKEIAAKELAVCFVDAVDNTFSKGIRKKIPSSLQADLNMYMIYFVFPALLKTEHEHSKLIADALCDECRSRFKESQFSYADYDFIYNSFREKIFGIF